MEMEAIRIILRLGFIVMSVIIFGGILGNVIYKLWENDIIKNKKMILNKRKA